MWMYSIPQTPMEGLRKTDYTNHLLSVLFFFNYYYYYSLLGENCVIVFRQFRRNFSTWACFPSTYATYQVIISLFLKGILYLWGYSLFFVFYTFCLNDKPVVTCTVWIKAIQFVTWLFLCHGAKRLKIPVDKTRPGCFYSAGDIHTANTKGGRRGKTGPCSSLG